jgi:tetratricopeptide (TPR) repeat protein
MLGIVLATAAAYSGTLSAPLIYDDHLWITWNPWIQNLGNLRNIVSPAPDSVVFGRPVLSLSLALNYAVSGNNSWSYHLANISFHILSALTLFGIVRRTLGFLPARFPAERDRILAAFAVALLWAVHPLQTESVTYVIQRAESLMGLFYLLTLYCFIRSLAAEGGRTWELLAVLCCLLGMATKEVMVTAPVLVLAYDRTFVAGSFREALRRRGRLYLALASTWLILCFFMIGLRGRGVGYGLGFSWWAYGLIETWVVIHYLLLAFWPYPLVFDYGTDIVGSLHEVLPWLCALVILAWAAVIGFNRRTLLGFAGIWFLLILAPGSSIIPVAFQPMAEHRMYLPLAGVMAFVVAAVWSALGRHSVPVLIAFAGALGTATFLRNADYQSEISLWGDTLLRRPDNERAHLALGSALALEGRNDEAAKQFREALRIDPGDFEARRNLGLALTHMGKADEALEVYAKIALPTPDSAPLHYDVGLALDRANRPVEAIEQYKRALQLDPTDGEARNNLGSALYRTGHVDEAIYQYILALGSKDDDARVHYNLGMALAMKGGVERAIAQYRAAIRLDPRYAEAHNNLANLLSQTGHENEAIAEYEAALRIRPGYEMARTNLDQLKALMASAAPH